jgi:hypothetical protein
MNKNTGPRSTRSKHPSLSAFLERNLPPPELLIVGAVVTALTVVVGTSVSIVVGELAVKPALVKEVDCGRDDTGAVDGTDDADDADEVPGTTALHSQIRLSSLFELSTKQP